MAALALALALPAMLAAAQRPGRFGGPGPGRSGQDIPIVRLNSDVQPNGAFVYE